MALNKATFRSLKSLQQKKIRRETGSFVVEGLRLTAEAAISDYEILEVYFTAEFAREEGGEALLTRLKKRSPVLERITAAELQRIADTVTPQGVMAVIRQRRYDVAQVLRPDATTSIVVAFDGVSDPGNLGSMIRTCDWFGVDAILHGNNCVELYNPKVVRGSMGGIFHLPIAEEIDLLPALSNARSLGYTTYVTDPKGETHFDRLHYERKSVIVFGNEAWGVSEQTRQLADMRVAIRRYGAAESLNVGVACGVILSSLHRLTDD
jgi:RNA methyltransferase, TrmH family